MTKSIPNSGHNHNVASPAYTVTILTCTGSDLATKTHKRAADGSVITDKFMVSKYPEHEVATFDGLIGLFTLIAKLASDPRKFVIRGCQANAEIF